MIRCLSTSELNTCICYLQSETIGWLADCDWQRNAKLYIHRQTATKSSSLYLTHSQTTMPLADWTVVMAFWLVYWWVRLLSQLQWVQIPACCCCQTCTGIAAMRPYQASTVWTALAASLPQHSIKLCLLSADTFHHCSMLFELHHWRANYHHINLWTTVFVH